ncbi:MAG: hypothetical protein E7368_03720 [Clostridiales bacterium]|nr:hypothetical protein [Clostridiales bacterium]
MGVGQRPTTLCQESPNGEICQEQAKRSFALSTPIGVPAVCYAHTLNTPHALPTLYTVIGQIFIYQGVHKQFSCG